MAKLSNELVTNKRFLIPGKYACPHYHLQDACFPGALIPDYHYSREVILDVVGLVVVRQRVQNFCVHVYYRLLKRENHDKLLPRFATIVYTSNSSKRPSVCSFFKALCGLFELLPSHRKLFNNIFTLTFTVLVLRFEFLTRYLSCSFSVRILSSSLL